MLSLLNPFERTRPKLRIIYFGCSATVLVPSWISFWICRFLVYLHNLHETWDLPSGLPLRRVVEVTPSSSQWACKSSSKSSDSCKLCRRPQRCWWWDIKFSLSAELRCMKFHETGWIYCKIFKLSHAMQIEGAWILMRYSWHLWAVIWYQGFKGSCRSDSRSMPRARNPVARSSDGTLSAVTLK